MNKCEDCINYDDNDSYPDTGWCKLNGDYVKRDDCCDGWEEK